MAAPESPGSRPRTNLDGPAQESIDPPRTAALLLIGNELLSGKVEEANLVVLARALRPLGVLLRRVVMIADVVAEIAAEVKALAAAHDLLVTSGGVGPTHDDVTVEAVSLAFGTRVVTDAGVEALLRAHYGNRITDAHLRMALIPEGAALETAQGVPWPTIRYQNTWLFPGVPEIFRLKLPVLVGRLGTGVPFVSRAVYSKVEEAVLKPLLDAVVRAFPDVDVGSYPQWNDPSYRTKLTFDGRDEARVMAARDAFARELTARDAKEPAKLE